MSVLSSRWDMGSYAERIVEESIEGILAGEKNEAVSGNSRGEVEADSEGLEGVVSDEGENGQVVP